MLDWQTCITGDCDLLCLLLSGVEEDTAQRQVNLGIVHD